VSSPPQNAYAAVVGHYDEMTLPSGARRPHWGELMGALEALGDVELMGRWQEAQRLIEENGVTYNVYGDPRGIDRPWQLDPIPMLLSPAEWAGIEAAVTQRALLLDRLLADLYGEGRLLRENRLPPEVVFANPGFLRPCRGLPIPNDCRLHVYAADLARSPDGQWWVLGDRTQAPSGAGYALENRVVMSRILPELFRDFHVRRLASYFQAYRDTLMELAPTSESPRVVLLTPGPYNETFFEHAYLARYLGVTLVEGADLTVRDQRVYLKTLSGLLPVHVILRRQDDHFCDPLELLGESALGVPGLVQAVRAGSVVVANALGSGVVETAATMAFLPGLCRHLLGEELRMPSVATWWCGQQRELEYVVANLEEVVVKPAFPSPRRDVVFGADLGRRDREAFVARIRAAPHRFVAQEQVALSTAPTGVEDGPSPRHLVLRVYAVRSGEGYVVMPGGLTRVSATSDNLVVSSQRGGGSKDTWVLADAPVPYTSLMDAVSRPIDVSRGSFALTSRIADNLFWLGRTAERAEAGMRLFRAALRRISEEPIRAADAPLPDAVVLLDRMAPPSQEEADAPAGVESAVLQRLFDRQPGVGVSASVDGLHRLAWLLRDRISTDAWRTLARLQQEFVAPETHPALQVNATLVLLDRGIAALSAFTGLVMESMTRGLGWQFLDIGRRLERGIQIVSLLRHGLVEPAAIESRRLETLLEVADSAMTYRSRYLTSVQVPLVLDLLLLDGDNPRALAFQLENLQSRFEALPKTPRGELVALREQLQLASPAELAELEEPDAAGARRRARLAHLLSGFETGLPALAEAIDHAYLSHAVPHRQPPRIGGATP
jgi:uncharacterized circularly permuted ATP-grasp superfamily protein/uncharacterized alpha-E superfamily protein